MFLGDDYNYQMIMQYNIATLKKKKKKKIINIMTVCYYHITYEFQIESTLYSLPECQGTACSKQEPYLKFKWQQRDLDPQPLSS